MDKKVLDYYSDMGNNKNHRYKSWEYCYINFKEVFNKNLITDEDKNRLALHLAFYLASWGMYRGSSFLLQKDYKVFYQVVELLFTNKDKFNEKAVDNLFNTNASIEGYVGNFFVFDKELEKVLSKIRKSINPNIKAGISYTLKTKIILGTYASIPAYDRFFQGGLRTYKNLGLTISYSKQGVIKIFHFAKDNLTILKKIKEEINKKQNNNELNKVDYPIMKIIDMFFWKVGSDRKIDD